MGKKFQILGLEFWFREENVLGVGGAKTACAFAPENHSPICAGMGAGVGVPLWGGAVRCIFAHTDGEKNF